MIARLPDHEDARLAALHQCRLLDTPPEAAYDDLTRLAAFICGTPIAAVSLIDAERQWFKATHGLDTTEVPRGAAFCAHTILQAGLLIVPDVQCDQRFSDNPFVTAEPHIRFYAGIPLVTAEGFALGSLCVLDTTPRHLTPEQEAALRVLARHTVREIELSRRIAIQEDLIAGRAAAEADRDRLAAIVKSSADAIISTDLGGNILSWNAGAERLYGYAAGEMVGQPQAALVPDGETSFHDNTLEALIGCERIENLEVVRRRRGGERIHVSLSLSLIRDASGNPVGVSAVGRDITERKRVAEALEAERQFESALLENLREGIVACDREGTLTLFNRASREFHGLPERPLPPAQWAEHFDLFHADGLTPMQMEDIPLFRAFQGEAVREAEMVIAPRGGPARTLLASGQAIRDARGEKLGAVVAMHDITGRKAAEQALRESKQFIESVTESSTSLIFVFDLDARANVYSNRNVAEFLGCSAEQVQAMDAGALTSLLHPDDLRSVRSHLARFAGKADHDVVELNLRARHASGEWRWLWSRTCVFRRRSDGSPHQILGTAHDVTEHVQAQEESARLAAIVESSHDAILGATLDGTLVSWNRAAEHLYGYSEAEILGQHASVLAPSGERRFLAEVTAAILRGERRENVEVKRQQKGGGWVDVSLTFSPIRDAAGQTTGIAAIARDITRQKQAEEALKDFAVVLEFQKQELEKANAQLERLATLDGLTGLRNRRAFDERLQEEFERACRYREPLSLLLLDIDCFKQYNDAFGHLAGDEVLRRIGGALKQDRRETDFVARYGGEEFAVILPGTDGEGAMQVAERLRQAVEDVPWDRCGVTISVGVCTLNLGMERPDEMIGCADRALYQSKLAGRNRTTHGYGSHDTSLSAQDAFASG